MAEGEQRLAFPHYKPEEIEVMKRFLRLGRLSGKWTFWVPVDTPMSIELRRRHAPEGEVWLWMKQIDAICETDTEIWIVEVKERVRPSAIGQLEVYCDLYRQMYNPLKPVRKMLIATIDDPSLHETLRRHKIRLELV